MYDTQSFEPVFSADIQSAKKEVLIVSPFARASRFRKTIPLLSFAQRNGARIVIITCSLENYTAEDAAKKHFKVYLKQKEEPTIYEVYST